MRLPQSNQIKMCISCGTQLAKYETKYCSNRCQAAYNYSQNIEKWKSGLLSGGRGVKARNMSGYIKRYLIAKFGEKCIICGWNQKHQITKRVPLEIDHIDGNSENNKEENLRLICPNCHSLSPTFRNLNRGHGRTWRKVV